MTLSDALQPVAKIAPKKIEPYTAKDDEIILQVTDDNCGHKVTEHYFSIPCVYRGLNFKKFERTTAMARMGFSIDAFIDGCAEFGVEGIKEIEGLPSRVDLHIKGTSGNY